MNNNNNNKGPGASSGGQACAACKHQRRKCGPDCPLAPFFPADRQQDFLNAHKLFGVSNIMKVIRDVSPSSRNTAMSAVIFQANARACDPVGGCHRIVLDLHRQVESKERELHLLQQQLAFLRSLDENNNNPSTQSVISENPCYRNMILEGKPGDALNMYDSLITRIVGNADIPQPLEEPTKIRESVDSVVKVKVEESFADEPENDLTSLGDTNKLASLADVSDDVKPFLFPIDERGNTVLFDSGVKKMMTKLQRITKSMT